MEWGRYYEETKIRPFNDQEPYYAYLLEQLSDYLSEGKGQDEPLFVALGGLHPKVTQPEHFISLCQKSLKHPFFPLIIDQNEQALKGLTGDNYLAVQAKLESLPTDIPPLSLIVCDYTTDFMSDEQLSSLNRNLPDRLDPHGLLFLTVDTPFIPGLSRIQNKLKYNVAVHPRKPEKLTQLLSNFKLIYMAETGNHNLLTVYAKKDSSLREHRGPAFALDPEEGNFSHWYSERLQKSAP